MALVYPQLNPISSSRTSGIKYAVKRQSASHTSSLASILYLSLINFISANFNDSRRTPRPVLIPSFLRHSLAYINSRFFEV
nr:MAG TPA: hypothetical protein [Caudoviricetes sp.]